MWKFIKRNKLLIFSLLYILSPFDFIPEFFLGPLGIVDDGGVVLVMLVKALYSFRKDQLK
jgi:uncharacterized membrane protein YkvA (DUF1232 family)